MEGTKTVCVTGASGFLGSWLVMKLLERGYFVRATVRGPGNVNKVKHLLELPKASTHLSLWRADLVEEGNFNDAIHGCCGVFHVASIMNFSSVEDPENEVINPTLNGCLNVMRSACKARTVKRFIYTSTTAAVTVQRQEPPEYDESLWSDVDLCYDQKFTGWSYYVAKTRTEKRAWEFAKQNGINLVSILPPLIIGPFITPCIPSSIHLATALITGNKAFYPLLFRVGAVHVDDLCNAHIFLFENLHANGRYICSSHNIKIVDLAESLHKKYPEYDIPTSFEGIDVSATVIPFSSKKLLDLGFAFKFDSSEYDSGYVFAEAIDCCKEKGLLVLP